MVSIATEIARALTHAHTHLLLHCDLKPGNIFLLATGGVKVLDFGLARHFRDADSGTTDAPADSEWPLGIAGTPAYMAPEQFADGPLDQRTDIYAFGVVMYEM